MKSGSDVKSISKVYVKFWFMRLNVICMKNSWENKLNKMNRIKSVQDVCMNGKNVSLYKKLSSENNS